MTGLAFVTLVWFARDTLPSFALPPPSLRLQMREVRGITRAEVRSIFKNMPRSVRLTASAIVGAARKKLLDGEF